MNHLDIYRGHLAVLTSQHEKQRLVAPSFREVLGVELLERALDTDQFGTFSGDIERSASPLDTAIAKARLGMKESGLPLGMASEGSVGPDPFIPFVISDIEHLVWVDAERDIVVSESHRSLDIRAASTRTFVGAELGDFLQRADFPRHRLIVKAENSSPLHCAKGIGSAQELEAAITECSSYSATGAVIVESDLRAHCSPSRQANIAAAARLLALRISTHCPDCHTPGWGKVGVERGLLCRDCSSFVEKAVRADVLGCVKCDFKKLEPRAESRADPAICNWCNP